MAPPEMQGQIAVATRWSTTERAAKSEKKVTSIKTARLQVTSHVDKTHVNVDLTAYPITQLSLSKVSCVRVLRACARCEWA